MLGLVKQLLDTGDEEGRAQAEPKRRTHVTHIGHTIPEIQQHLKASMGDRYPDAGISKSTIRRLLAAPTKK